MLLIIIIIILTVNGNSQYYSLLSKAHYKKVWLKKPVYITNPVVYNCIPHGSVVLLHAAHVFDYFAVIEIAFIDNQAQITETISQLDSEKVRW